MKIASRRLPLVLIAVFFLAGRILPGQERDDYGAPAGYDDSRYEDDDIRQTVARVSEIEGRVSYSRGDDPDDWQPADRNVPVTIGDRLYADTRSRAELQVHGGDFVRLGAGTDLAVLNLTDDTKQFALKSGVASFQVRYLDDWQVFEVDTPNAAVTFETPGDYRIDVDSAGFTRVAVRNGRAQVAAGGGSITVGRGDAMVIEGFEDPRYDFVDLRGPDGWDRWVLEREGRISRARSHEYVHADIAGVDDLDDYGRWENIPSYGWAWSPTRVAVGWAPYRVGKWIWQDPWGWTWLSDEPWGWAPYHHGRWVFVRSRWCWVPVARRVTDVHYFPALVAFTAGGPGWSASFSAGGGGYVGWFPLAPREPFIPWWGRPRVTVNVTNVTYVNRTYVTVVNRNTFVSGGVVTSSVVSDRAVVRQVAAAPVLRGPLPVVPTQGAIRVAARPAPAPRPPAAAASRPVVVRMAPPPAPLRFEQKVAVIRENRGAPLTPDESARIAVRERGRPQSITAVRPAAAETGRVELAPKSARNGRTREAQRPTPISASEPVRGRPAATSQRPVASEPVAAPPEARNAARRRQSAPASDGDPGSPDRSPRSMPVRPDHPPASSSAARSEKPAPETHESRAAQRDDDSRERDRPRQRVTAPSAPQPPARPAPVVTTPRSDQADGSRQRNPAPPRSGNPQTDRPAATPPDQDARSRQSAESARSEQTRQREVTVREVPKRSNEQSATQPDGERREAPPRATPKRERAESDRRKEEPRKKPTPEKD